VVVIDRGVVIADDSPAGLKSLVPGKRVSFRTSKSLSRAVFEGEPVASLEVGDRSVRFLSNQPERVLARLFRDGVELEGLEVVGADLEEAFLSLTSRARAR
jgi:ABC-2 type transport system ATP-binding protein